MAVHQCARVCNNMRLFYKFSVRHIAKYLSSTSTYVDLPDANGQLSTHGVVYNPYKEKIIKCYVDANFAGGWAQLDYDDAENFVLSTVYVITYAGCSVI